MSLGTTSTDVGIADAKNTAEVSNTRRLQVSEPELQRLIALADQHNRLLTKLVLIVSQMSGINLDDSEIDTPSY